MKVTENYRPIANGVGNLWIQVFCIRNIILLLNDAQRTHNGWRTEVADRQDNSGQQTMDDTRWTDHRTLTHHKCLKRLVTAEIGPPKQKTQIKNYTQGETKNSHCSDCCCCCPLVFFCGTRKSADAPGSDFGRLTALPDGATRPTRLLDSEHINRYDLGTWSTIWLQNTANTNASFITVWLTIQDAQQWNKITLPERNSTVCYTNFFQPQNLLANCISWTVILLPKKHYTVSPH